jgi:uncharacterized protein
LSELLPLILFFVAALLFTSVGHGGASGYLAVMGLLGFAPTVLRSTALSLNIVAACIALIIFYHRGRGDGSLQTAFFWRQLMPFLVTSLPLSYLGGSLNLSGGLHKAVVGVVLFWAAWQLLKPLASLRTPVQNDANLHTALPANPWWVWPAGAVIGLVSGLTGVGGGIFLSPLLVLTRLCTVRQSAPISAAFILLNSVTGLLGVLRGQHTMPEAIPYWLCAVAIAAFIGASWGSRTLHTTWLRRVLGVVLIVAGAKLVAAVL